MIAFYEKGSGLIVVKRMSCPRKKEKRLKKRRLAWRLRSGDRRAGIRR